MRLLTASFICFAWGTLGYATIFDIKADWSDVNNPNGVWTLRKSPTAIFTTNQADFYANGTNQKAWADQPANQLQHVPVWMKGTVVGAGYTDFPLGEIYLHGAEVDRTGSNYTSAVWTSSEAGTAAISGSLWNVRHLGRSMFWQLRKNGATLSSGSISSSDPYTSSSPLNLSAGSGGAAALTQSIIPGTQLELAFISPDSNLGELVGVRYAIQTNIGTESVSGSLTLSDFVGSASGSSVVPVTIRVLDNANNLLQSTNLNVATSAGVGTYSLGLRTGITGAIKLAFDAPTWLVKTITSSVGASNANAVLANGDAVKDGVIDLSDYTVILTAFNALPASENWNVRADLNRDDVVDLTDYIIVVTNFNQLNG